MSRLTAWIGSRIAAGDRGLTVGHLNLHALYLGRRDERMREFLLSCAAVHLDGMAAVLLAQLAGQPARREHRITYVDWIVPLARAAVASEWRVFLLGGRPGVGERAAKALRERVPGFTMSCRHGYFDATPGSVESEEVLAAIRRVRPDLLFVGMGMPRQEHWIRTYAERTDAGVILASGACMDYAAGVIPTPPRWLGRLGLEWLYRLAHEPRRLAWRYLVEPWLLLPAVLDALAQRRR